MSPKYDPETGAFEVVYDRGELFDYIMWFRIENNGHAPTRRQFELDFGMSTNTAQYALKEMVEEFEISFREYGKAGFNTPGQFIPPLWWLEGQYPHIEDRGKIVLQFLQDQGYFKIKERVEIKDGA